MIRRVLASAMIAVVACLGEARAFDPDSCANDLQSLQFAAQRAQSAASDAESENNDLEDCRDDDDPFDRGCEDAVRAYRNALDNLSLQMNDVGSKIIALRFSCGLPDSVAQGFLMVPNPGTVPSLGDGPGSACLRLLIASNSMSGEALRQACQKMMTVDECGRCLALAVPAVPKKGNHYTYPGKGPTPKKPKSR